MLEELRLYPRSPAARIKGSCPGDSAAIGRGGLRRGLSTGYAGRGRLRSTGACSAALGQKEEVD